MTCGKHETLHPFCSRQCARCWSVTWNPNSVDCLLESQQVREGFIHLQGTQMKLCSILIWTQCRPQTLSLLWKFYCQFCVESLNECFASWSTFCFLNSGTRQFNLKRRWAGPVLNKPLDAYFNQHTWIKWMMWSDRLLQSWIRAQVLGFWFFLNRERKIWRPSVNLTVCSTRPCCRRDAGYVLHGHK